MNAFRVASNRDDTGIRVGPRRPVSAFYREEPALDALDALDGTALDGTALGGFLRLARGRGSRLEHAEIC